ncbi:MAG: glycosyltransferase family 87 protein [Anaerolineales bacterium]
MNKVKHLVAKYWAWMLAAIYLAAVAVYIFSHPDSLQWDFKTYYYAGLAFARGQDPYFLHTLSTIAGQEIGFPFAYPPLTLPLFRLFSIGFKYSTAFSVYFVLKLTALGALVVMWVRNFLPSKHLNIFPFVLIFGFSGAIYLDLVAGNISIFEQLGLWAAFLALRRRKVGLFSALIAIVACFKITPIVFLLLPLLLDDQRYWKEPLAALAAWGGLQLASFAFQPQLYSNFLTLASRLDERMPHNPSILALLRDVSQWLSEKVMLLPDWLPIVVFLLLALTVIWMTWQRLRRSLDSWNYRLFLACLAYAIIMPRFKNYSFILLLVPAYFFVVHVFDNRINIGLLLLLLSASIPLPFGLSGPASNLVWGYYPILFTALLWWLAVRLDQDHPPVKTDQILPKET